MTRSSKVLAWCAAGLGLFLAGCMTVQPVAFPVGPPRTAKAPDAPVQIFREAPPAQPFTTVVRLNVHIEKTFFVPSAFEEARPKLEALARQHGGDAIIAIEEKKSRLNETFIYNVSATAIAFAEPWTGPEAGGGMK